MWRLHSKSRITASNLYDVIHCKSDKTKTLLNKLTNYVVAPPNLPSFVYGKEIEAVAKKVIFIWLKNTTQISWFIAKYLSTLMLSTLIWKHLLMVLLPVVARERVF